MDYLKNQMVALLNINYKRQKELEKELEWLKEQACQLEHYLEFGKLPD